MNISSTVSNALITASSLNISAQSADAATVLNAATAQAQVLPVSGFPVGTGQSGIELLAAVIGHEKTPGGSLDISRGSRGCFPKLPDVDLSTASSLKNASGTRMFGDRMLSDGVAKPLLHGPNA